MLQIGILAVALIAFCSPASADSLRIGGTGAVTKMLPKVFDTKGGDELEVIPSLGTGGGLRALADGLLDIAVSGRPLAAEEKKKGLAVVAAIRTPYVLITSKARPDGLKSTEIADIFKLRKTLWSDGSRIRLILRPKSDSDSVTLGAMFPGMAAALEEARLHREIPIAATDQDNATLAEEMPGSLAGATFTQIKTEQRNLRFVAIDGVEPSLENLERGLYPYSKTLYFVMGPHRASAAERFIAHLHSPSGEAALRAASSLPIEN